MPTLETVFLYNKANEYGLSQDAKILEKVWTSAGVGRPQNKDPLEPPIICDVAVHLEVPIYGWMPWARVNIFVVNPEWWEAAWDPYLERVDFLVFKCEVDRAGFFAGAGARQSHASKALVLPWTTDVTPKDFAKKPRGAKGCLWLLGASTNKRAAAEHLLTLWKPDWPQLEVYTTSPLTGRAPLSPNVNVHVRDLPEQTRRELQAYYPIHLIFSRAEALGLAAAEGLAAGARLIGNALPVYKERYEPHGALLTSATLVPLGAGRMDTFESLTQEVLEGVVVAAVAATASGAPQPPDLWTPFATAAAAFLKDFAAGPLLASRKKLLRALPPQIAPNELPPISVITLLHNRRKFVDLAFHNLLISDYPKDKIEWVVVEDSDNVDEQASDKILKFGRKSAPMSVTYIPLPKPVSIGEKRNIACRRAQHDIILMMDDDDHYPPTSFRRRVSWLLRHPWNPHVVCATTIACYDLIKGTSAVNTPPWSLPLCKRVSEATLAFKKSWWETRPFPNVSMSEGEGFLGSGQQQSDVLEIPPQQIIVAMSHGQNASSRRIPPGPSGKPSCFWGFPPEFLKFLHGLAGVVIE